MRERERQRFFLKEKNRKRKGNDAANETDLLDFFLLSEPLTFAEGAGPDPALDFPDFSHSMG